MATDAHLCPYGLKAKDLLARRGFRVEDHLLRSREETEAFKAEHQVRTTPQVFIAGERVGGYDDLRRRFGARDPNAPTYAPVVAVFATAAVMALAASQAAFAAPLTLHALQWFAAFAVCLLAMLKLRDVEAFSSMFLGYDLLARRWVRYAYIYPFAELLAGALMAAGVLPWLSGPLGLALGGIGAASVFKAVYLDRRELKCACVGGDSKTPLGLVSLLENLLMIGMGGWMLAA